MKTTISKYIMKFERHLVMLLIVFSFGLGNAPSAEKGTWSEAWVEFKSARGAYRIPDARAELVGFNVYPLDVVSELSDMTQVIRITITRDWEGSSSYVISQNGNGFAIEKVHRISDPYGLRIDGCAIEKDTFDGIVRSFDQARQSISRDNKKVDPEMIAQVPIPPLVLLEKMTRNGEYTGLIAPARLGLASKALEEAISKIDIACPDGTRADSLDLKPAKGSSTGDVKPPAKPSSPPK